MSTPSGVPSDAMCINYTANNGKKGDYFVWSRSPRIGSTRVTTHYWYALGNNGEDTTALGAADAAKSWIRNGQSGVKRIPSV